MKKAVKPALVEERAFPLECSTSYGVEEDYRMMHWHQEMEICYIKNGTGKYLINGIEYDFSKGDIFIINNDEIHLCHDDHNLEMMVIMFHPNFLQGGWMNAFDFEYLRPFFNASESFCNQLEHSNPYTSELAEVLLEIEKEYTAQNNGYELMIKALLLKFLTLIIRNFLSNEQTMKQKKISRTAVQKIYSIITYIDQNYTQDISLKQLSETFSISIPYLSSTFHTFTGVSPMHFVIQKRILAAKHELISTEKTILTISEECGFSSISNFNHLFKSIVGCSPSEYRKK